MKFKKHELITLSPGAVADYLQEHGWHQDRGVEGKGTIWLHKDDEGNEFEIMLPTNRDLGDFAIRMSEAIHTLAAVEERNLYEVHSALAEKHVLPSDVFEGQIAAEDLEWNASEKAKLEPLLESLNHALMGGTFFACLAEVVSQLAREPTLIGTDSSKTSAVWQSCEKILLMVGWQFKENRSRTGFWNAARKGQAAIWLEESISPREDVGATNRKIQATRNSVP